jgi:glyoxylase-like metal-dependent hydrolase (beta-lactamase superfamily II)
MVPLLGHTAGHCGITLQTDGGWMLHAGDAYFHRWELDVGWPRCPPGLRGYQPRNGSCACLKEAGVW